LRARALLGGRGAGGGRAHRRRSGLGLRGRAKRRHHGRPARAQGIAPLGRALRGDPRRSSRHRGWSSMTRGRPSPRAKRPTGWLSGSKGSSHRGKMPLWQWIVAVPVLILLLGGIALFAYLTMFNPRMGAGVRTETVLVLERVEHRASDGTLDTAGSYLLV